MNFVSIIMGSKCDHEVMNECAKTLANFGVPYEMIVSSAHRSPQRTHDYVKNAETKGAKVFICAAGMAAPTVAVGKAGAVNAAFMAMQILALMDGVLASKLMEDRETKARNVEADSQTIEVRL